MHNSKIISNYVSLGHGLSVRLPALLSKHQTLLMNPDETSRGRFYK